MMIGLVTGEEEEGEEGKSHCKVGTRWVRQSSLNLFDDCSPEYISDLNAPKFIWNVVLVCLNHPSNRNKNIGKLQL